MILYCISKSVNRIIEFKMDYKDGVLGYYELVYPSYTIFHTDDKIFSSIWSEYDDDFCKFHQNIYNDKVNYGDKLSYQAKTHDIKNLFFVSSLPWISFKDFNLYINRNEFYRPVFTLSKIKDSCILLNINVNHALCDGYHVYQFIDSLQDCIYQFKIT